MSNKSNGQQSRFDVTGETPRGVTANELAVPNKANSGGCWPAVGEQLRQTNLIPSVRYVT